MINGNRSFPRDSSKTDRTIETPHAVFAARGTEYLVSYDPSAKSLAGKTFVDVLEGVVEGKESSGNVKVKAGQRYITDGKTSRVEASPRNYLGVHPWLVSPHTNRVVVLKRTTSPKNPGTGRKVMPRVK